MENKGLTNINDAAYQKLIDNITALWGEAKSKAVNGWVSSLDFFAGR